jgi:hypothetical protein
MRNSVFLSLFQLPPYTHFFYHVVHDNIRKMRSAFASCAVNVAEPLHGQSWISCLWHIMQGARLWRRYWMKKWRRSCAHQRKWLMWCDEELALKQVILILCTYYRHNTCIFSPLGNQPFAWDPLSNVDSLCGEWSLEENHLAVSRKTYVHKSLFYSVECGLCVW